MPVLSTDKNLKQADYDFKKIQGHMFKMVELKNNYPCRKRWGRCFCYIDQPRTPSFPIGLVKTEYDFVSSVETGLGR